MTKTGTKIYTFDTLIHHIFNIIFVNWIKITCKANQWAMDDVLLRTIVKVSEWSFRYRRRRQGMQWSVQHTQYTKGEGWVNKIYRYSDWHRCILSTLRSKSAARRANVNANRPAVVAAAAAVLPAVRKHAARERLISNFLNGRRLPDLSLLQKSINLHKVLTLAESSFPLV